MDAESTSMTQMARVRSGLTNGIDNIGMDNEPNASKTRDRKTSLDDGYLRTTDYKPDSSSPNAPMPALDGKRNKDMVIDTTTPPLTPQFTPPNGGYAWVIVFASFVAIVLVDGIMFSFGVLLVALIEDLNESTASVAALGGILNGCIGISAPLSGSLIDVFGKRSVTIFGSVLLSVGLLASRFANHIGWLYLLYGILGGFGFGFMVTPPLASAMEHFTTKRPLASGIALCGSGVGVFVMNISASYLLETYGWQGSFLILSALMMNGIPCGLAIPRDNWKVKHKHAQENNKNVDTTSKPAVKSIMERVKRTIYVTVWTNNISSVHSLKCFCILLSSFFFGLAGYVPFSYLPKQAVTLGMQKQQAAWITSSSGISNALVRIGIGWIGSRSLANHKTKLSVIILIIDAACFPISLLLPTFGSKLAYAVVYGGLYGANVLLFPVMLAESVPAEKVDKAIGLFISLFCAGGLLGIPLAGWTVDITGDFVVCYILAGVQTFIAAILLIIPALHTCVSGTVVVNRTTHF